MSDIPLSLQLSALAVLLVFSGLFSMAETTMMASNQYRLRSMATNGHRGAQLAIALLGETEKLLGVILLFNNLVNAAAAGSSTIAWQGTAKPGGYASARSTASPSTWS